MASELTALFWAMHLRNSSMIDLLLQNGATLKDLKRGDFSPLHVTARYANERLSKILVRNGANVNADSTIGLTPLHCAVLGQDVNICEMLISNGADPNAQTARSNGMLVPLHIAIKARSVEIVKILHENNADVGLKCDEGFNALEYAIRIKDAKMYKLLINSMK